GPDGSADLRASPGHPREPTPSTMSLRLRAVRRHLDGRGHVRGGGHLRQTLPCDVRVSSRLPRCGRYAAIPCPPMSRFDIEVSDQVRWAPFSREGTATDAPAARWFLGGVRPSSGATAPGDFCRELRAGSRRCTLAPHGPGGEGDADGEVAETAPDLSDD